MDQQAVSLLFLVGLFAVMYLLFIRPQTKRRKEMQSMQQSLDVGVHVLTVGGLYGTVLETEGDAVLLEVAPDVAIWYSRGAVGKLVDEDKMPGMELVPDDEDADETAAVDAPATAPADKLTKADAAPAKTGAADRVEAVEETPAESTKSGKSGTDGATRTSGKKGPG